MVLQDLNLRLETSRADKIKDLITEYEIDGYKFLRFTTDQGYKFGFDDVVSGASLSEIVKANGAVVTLTGVWEKNSYTIHYENATTAEEAAKYIDSIKISRNAKITYTRNADIILKDIIRIK